MENGASVSLLCHCECKLHNSVRFQLETLSIFLSVSLKRPILAQNRENVRTFFYLTGNAYIF